MSDMGKGSAWANEHEKADRYYKEMRRLTDENEQLKETIKRWQACGDNIMLVAVGRVAPLSDADVISVIQGLREKLAEKGVS